MKKLFRAAIAMTMTVSFFHTAIDIHATEKDDSFSYNQEAVTNGWSSDGQMYYENGKYITGQKKIGGYWYYFDDKTGKMVHGWKYIESQHKTVWYGQESGHMLYGEVRIDGKWYYLNDKNGAVTYGWKYIENKDMTCFYDANGQKVFGIYQIEGKTYEFDSETGALIGEVKNVIPDGWNEAQDQYYLDGVYITGQKKIGGYWYYFDEATGKKITGWKEIPSQKKTVYYDGQGRMLKGVQTIDGKTYEFSTKTGALIGEVKPVIADGWNEAQDQYYLDGAYITGQKKIDGYWYYFDETTGKKITGWKEITAQGKTVYYDEQGRMLKGIQTIDGKTYEFSTKTGALLREVKLGASGTWNDAKDMYYVNGSPVKGEIEIDGFRYYFDDTTGKMVHGWKYLADKDITVWYGAETGHMLFGEVRIDGKWYYLDDETGGITYGWKEIPRVNKKVYYDKNGHMLFGEQKIGGYWYYLNDSTGAVTYGWKYIPSKKKTVYYDKNGHMLYGQQKINGYWYYLNEKTGARITGWKYIESQHKTVYYNENGQMVYGEQVIDGVRYTFNTKSGALMTQISDGWNAGKTMYYKAGKYLTGQQKIDGSWYYFNTSGVKQTGKVSIPASANSGTAKNVITDSNGAYITRNTKQGLVYYSVSSATDAVNVGKIEYEKKIYKEGIDISEWNGDIDLSGYKKQFIIIRASWGQTHKDKRVEQYVAQCEKLGIPYGFYTYSYAQTNAEAKQEAQFCLSIINDIKKKQGGKLNYFCMGIWFDMEDADHWKARQGFKFTNANISGLCYTFCNEIWNKGYYTGTYMSASWLKYLKGSNADKFDKWVAHWGTRNSEGEMTVDTSASGTMQQYTSTGGKLDKDVIFVDPSVYAKKNQLN